MSGLGQFGAEWDLMVEVQLVVQGMVLEGSSLQGLGSRAQPEEQMHMLSLG